MNNSQFYLNIVHLTCDDVCLSLCNGYEEKETVKRSGMNWTRGSFVKTHFCSYPADPHPYLEWLPLDQECSLESVEVLSPIGTA